MDEVCEGLEYIREVLDEPELSPPINDKCLMDFQYDLLSTLHTLSDTGHMDRVFNIDPTGGLRHQSLVVLRLILGLYYPTVYPLVGSLTGPGPNDPSGPIESDIYDYLTCSLRPMADASTQAPDPPLETVPVSFKSRDRRKRQAATRQSLAS